MVSPAADVDVNEGLVRSLLSDQHPDLAEFPLTRLDAGWDNVLWRLGDDLVVRLPRREAAAVLTVNEQRWLPQLAGRLPLPVPVPVRVGRPAAGYPWAWSVTPWLAGVPGDRAEVSDAAGTAGRLGRFLRALHQPAGPDAPPSTVRGVPLAAREAMFEQRLAALAGEVDAGAVETAWRTATGADPHHGTPRWLHGDLHPANMLYTAGRLSAVIDFGDVCAGDPATDLAALWMSCPTSAHGAFDDAYDGMSPDLHLRSLGWAVLFGLMLLQIGLDDKPTYEAVGRRTLERVVAALA